MARTTVVAAAGSRFVLMSGNPLDLIFRNPPAGDNNSLPTSKRKWSNNQPPPIIPLHRESISSVLQVHLRGSQFLFSDPQ